jgi:hypothetical protein
MSNLKQQFEQQGYIVLHNVLTNQELEFYKKALLKVGEDKKKKSWTMPDGVIQHEDFWTTIWNETVLNTVKELLGDDVKYMQHNDLHLGYSSFAWHRDSINRAYDQNLPDWREAKEPYQIVRCGYYLQPEENNFHLGVLPGSHKLSGYLDTDTFLEYDKKLSNFENVKAKFGGKDWLKEQAVWIKTKPGDCVIFDPRLIHTGGEFEAEKYSFFNAYGIENIHFKQHYTYYRHLRYDLKYQSIPYKLAEVLKVKNLYAAETKLEDKIDGAWIPSTAFSFVANFFE